MIGVILFFSDVNQDILSWDTFMETIFEWISEPLVFLKPYSLAPWFPKRILVDKDWFFMNQIQILFISKWAGFVNIDLFLFIIEL